MKEVSTNSQDPHEQDYIEGECYEEVDGAQLYRNVLKELLNSCQSGTLVDIEL